MAFSVIISPRAQKEIQDSIEFYAQNSEDAPLKFITELERIYELLTINPFYRTRYKNVRAVALIKFPLYLYFKIDEREQTVSVLSCFHGRRNPNARP